MTLLFNVFYARIITYICFESNVGKKEALVSFQLYLVKTAFDFQKWAFQTGHSKRSGRIPCPHL